MSIHLRALMRIFVSAFVGMIFLLITPADEPARGKEAFWRSNELPGGATQAVSADGSQLTKEQIKQFLQTAEVIKSKESTKGVTHPSRLTLSDGKITHDASFQTINEYKPVMKLESGATETNFVDSWKYNVAGYEIADLIGLGDMVPVYVERKWQGKTGSLSWWLPVMMDDAERHEKNIAPPDQDAWNKQMHRMRVFDELIYDTDANLTNILIGKDWTLWRIDFTRAFRRSRDLHRPNDLVKCDRQLLGKLKALTAEEVLARTKGFLNKDDVQAVMARRDKIVTRFEQLAAQQGEATVFY